MIGPVGLANTGQVGGDEDVAVRHDLGAGPDPAAARVEEPERHGPLDRERGERPSRIGFRHGHAEHEERRQRPEGVELREPPLQQWNLAGPRQDRPFGPEGLSDRVPLEPGGDEYFAQLGNGARVGDLEWSREARERRLHLTRL